MSETSAFILQDTLLIGLSLSHTKSSRIDGAISPEWTQDISDRTARETGASLCNVSCVRIYSHTIVVLGISSEQMKKMPHAKYQHMVKARRSDRPDHPFTIAIFHDGHGAVGRFRIPIGPTFLLCQTS